MSLFAMNALWFSLIIDGRITFSLLTTHFDAILETTLLKLMGRYSVMVGIVSIFNETILEVLKRKVVSIIVPT